VGLIKNQNQVSIEGIPSIDHLDSLIEQFRSYGGNTSQLNRIIAEARDSYLLSQQNIASSGDTSFDFTGQPQYEFRFPKDYSVSTDQTISEIKFTKNNNYIKILYKSNIINEYLKDKIKYSFREIDDLLAPSDILYD